MAGSKVLQFFLFISFVIFLTHALSVYLTDGQGKSGFEYRTDIDVRFDTSGMQFNGCAINKTYTAGPATTKIIVYIKSYTAMKRTILQECCKGIRASIANLLSVYHIELLYLGVMKFTYWERHLVGEFLHQSIKPHQDQANFQINTIGEKRLDLIYETSSGDLTRYQEDENVFGGNLQGHIRSIHSSTNLTDSLQLLDPDDFTS